MGSATGSARRRWERGRRTFDIRDFGAIPDDTTVMSANSVAIQAAIDAAVAARTNGRSCTVYVPAGTFYVGRPIHLDHPITSGDPGLYVRGEGPSSSLSGYGGTSHDILAIGISRRPNGVGVATSDFVDLNGVLDSSAAGSPGQRWGFRTRENFITVRGGHFDASHLGPGLAKPDGLWSEVTTLTIDFAVDLGVGDIAPINDVALMGMTWNENRNQPSPWRIRLRKIGGKPQLELQLYISDGRHLSGTRYTLNVNLPEWGFYRVSYQLDLNAGTAHAWVNGSKVALNGTPPPARSRFVPNYVSVFGVGGFGPNGAFPSAGPETTWDFVFCGLKLSRVKRYHESGEVGSAQATSSYPTLNDNFRYFATDSDTIALFRLNDPPALAASDRVLTTACGINGTHTSSAYVIHNSLHKTYLYPARNIHLRDLRLSCGTSHAGQAIAVGQMLACSIRDVTALGGLHGIGSKKLCGSWDNNVSDVTLGGRLSYLDGFIWSDHIERVHVQFPAARMPFVFDQSNVALQSIYQVLTGDPDYLVFATESNLRVRGYWTDYEGGTYPRIAGFYASNPPAKFSRLEFSDCYVGSTSYDRPVFIFHQVRREGALNTNRCTVSLKDICSETYEQSALIQVDGPVFHGEYTAEPEWPRPRWIQDLTGGRCNLVTRHTNYTSPPRTGIWTKHLHELVVRRPAEGRPRRYRCVKSGGYGQPTPPEWRPIELEDGDPTRLAADLIGHSYWTAGATKDDALGFWSDYVQMAVLNRLLKQLALAPPTTVFASLHTTRAHRTGPYREVLANRGYVRQAVTATRDGVGGARLEAFGFGPATADWQGDWPKFIGPPDINAIFLMDAATGGNPLMAVDLANTRVLAGQSLAFSAGQVRLAQAPLGSGGFSRAFESEVAATFLGGAPLPTRPVFLALSTSRADAESPPSEPPAGTGYARVSTTPASWSQAYAVDKGPDGTAYSDVAISSNAQALNFPAAIGDWGAVRSIYLMDAPAGGNVIAAAELVAPRSVRAGDPPIGFDPGAFRITRV